MLPYKSSKRHKMKMVSEIFALSFVIMILDECSPYWTRYQFSRFVFEWRDAIMLILILGLINSYCILMISMSRQTFIFHLIYSENSGVTSQMSVFLQFRNKWKYLFALKLYLNILTSLFSGCILLWSHISICKNLIFIYEDSQIS